MTLERSLNLNGCDARGWRLGLVRWTAATLLGLLSAAALVVVVRRLAGALENPLQPAAMLIAGVLLATIACGVRAGWRLGSHPTSLSRADWTVPIVTSLAVTAIGVALSIGGTHFIGLLAFWTLLGAEEAWAWHGILTGRASPSFWSAFRSRREGRAETPAPKRARPSAAARVAAPSAGVDELPPEHVTQQLVRSREAGGSDVLAGYVRIAFAAGQRTGSIHVAFCPPFAETPELAVEQIDGPEARIKTAQLLPYGARLDLKLAAQAAQPAGVLLQFEARQQGTGPADE